jgi:creatinine amidohydrolase
MVDMTWPAIAERAGKGDIILLPVGIIEAHGPHMDLGADILLAHRYCRLLHHELELKSIHALVAPPIYWGHAADTARYAGTFSVKPQTMKALLADILESLDSWGFRKVFLVNCHGDRTHLRMIEESIAEANRRLTLQTIDLSRLDITLCHPPAFPLPRKDRFEPDVHAGAIETAQMHAFFPNRVNAELARTLPPSDSFHPMAYCGDPAGFELEEGIAAYLCADLETDVRKIEAFLLQATP